MLYLIWSLLNIGLLLYFLFIFFTATKLLKERLGIIATVVFVFAFFSFISASKPTQVPASVLKYEFSQDSTEAYDIIITKEKVVLEKNMMFEVDLSITKGQTRETLKKIPVTAFTSFSGFTIGYEWNGKAIFFNQYESKLTYQILAEIKFNLLGFTIVNRTKSYEGTIEIK